MTDTVTFTIGGKPYEVSILHLAAQRVLLRGLPDAMTSFGMGNVDPLVALFLATFACQVEDEYPELTARFIERNLLGEEQSKGFMTAMWKLVEVSGFKVGEMLAILTAGLSESPTSIPDSSSTT